MMNQKREKGALTKLLFDLTKIVDTCKFIWLPMKNNVTCLTQAHIIDSIENHIYSSIPFNVGICTHTM